MAIKAISQFDAAMPASNDKILFEQNGDGKSCSIGNAVNTCSLTLEEIMATTDLTGKVASASSAKEIKQNTMPFYQMKSENDFRGDNSIGTMITNSSDPAAYITFNILWVKIQFKVIGVALYVRYKYGNTEASNWKLLAP